MSRLIRGHDINSETDRCIACGMTRELVYDGRVDCRYSFANDIAERIRTLSGGKK